MKRSSTLWSIKSFQSPLVIPQNIHLYNRRIPKYTPALVGRPQSIRYATSQTKSRADESGHIKVGDGEGMFFIDNVFPMRLQWLFYIPFINPEKSLWEVLKRFNRPNIAAADPTAIIKRALPPQIPLKIKEVIPRLKDGGAFVVYSREPGTDSQELESTLRDYLQKNPIKPWFNPSREVGVARVLGKPWLEDLYRFPSPRIKAEFLPTSPEAPAAELNQETLYSLFRRYGKLTDIVAQPSDSKILPKYAHVEFRKARHAILAKNCLHGFRVAEEQGGGKAGTNLKLTYERKPRAHWVRDWMVNHPRVVIPIVAAILATITVIIFDPIRTFFIKIRIIPPLHLDDNIVWQWIRKQASRANEMIPFGKQRAESGGFNVIWDNRRDDIEQIQSWLVETADTFIVVQGPRGTGKKELVVDQALKDRKYKLVIDCRPIQEAHGESSTIAAAAAQVGYWPVFSSMNTINSLVDLAAQGTIGTKAGFSETLDAQLNKIWQNTTSALKKIALDGRRKDDKDAQLSDDEYLEAHPERRPVLIIDNFLHRSNEESIFYDKLADWAATLIYTNIAHVIFLTTDSSFSKSLSKALPNQVFRQISLTDCSPEVGKQFVLNHLEANSTAQPGEVHVPNSGRTNLGELESCIETLGGRLTDLEFLARRIEGGESPRNAVGQIIGQSASEILKMYILEAGAPHRQWTREQAWFLIKKLPKEESASLRYNEILLSDLFKDDGERTIQALAQAELISITTAHGRPCAIKPGKPVYQAAFQKLVQDEALKSRLDLSIMTQLIANQNQNIRRYEEELQLLGSLPNQPYELQSRTRWLLQKVWAAQTKIEQLEMESAVQRKVLQNKY